MAEAPRQCAVGVPWSMPAKRSWELVEPCSQHCCGTRHLTCTMVQKHDAKGGCQESVKNRPQKNKKPPFTAVSLMVVGQGFEPWKAMPTDLQSVLFDRSRIPPQIHAFDSLASFIKWINGARGGTRTRKDLSTCTSSMRVCQFHHPSNGGKTAHNISYCGMACKRFFW